jgi:ELWxxDGT repeat protein
MRFRNVIVAALLAATLAPRLGAQTTQLKSGLGGDTPAALNGLLYFAQNYDVDRGLWKTDGTVAGTQLVKAIGWELRGFVPCGDQLFFNVMSGSGLQLWRSDGTTAGTTLLRQLSNGYLSDPPGGGCVQRTYYFAMPAPELPGAYPSSYDLYRTDGTAANTFLLARNTGRMVATANARGRLYFLAPSYYSSYGNLWTSDGTAAGTVLLQSGDFIQPQLATLGTQLLYALHSYPTDLLLRTGGTTGDSVSLTSGSVGPPYTVGSQALFFKNGIWATDGTPAGTTTVRWPMTTHSYSAFQAAASSGRLYFVAADANQSTDSLWRSDGTNAGTAPLAAIPDASLLTDVDGLLVFRSGTQTFATDGTSAPAAIASILPDRILKAGTRGFLVYNATLYSWDLTFAASSLSPGVVPMSGGTPVTIAGIGFGAGTTVTIDGVAVTPSALTATTIAFNAPAHAQGPADVVVTRAGGQQARMNGALTFACDTTPVAVASGSATVCPLAPVALTGSGGVACSWLPATGLSDSTSCTPTVTPAESTTYRLTVTNASGCSSTNAADVVVTVKAVASVVITTTMATTYSGDSTASVPVTAGATYHWTITNGTIVSDPDQPSITFHTNCTDARLDVTATGPSGCPATANVTVSPRYPRSLTHVSPEFGPPGTTLKLTGTGLNCVTALRIGVRYITTNFHIDSDTQITLTSDGYGRIDALINGQWVIGVNTYFLEFIPPVPGDLDGDRKPDLVFRNPSTGLDAVWQLNGTSFATSTNLVSFANADYHIVGMANFDGDWANDLLLHNGVTGASAIWKMQYMSYVGVVNLPAIPDTNFELEGTGDFNGDGKPDILIRNQVTGANAVWLMNGMAMDSTANLPALPSAGYRICGSGDFNGDGKADIVWRNASTGANAVWLMNGTAYLSTLNLPALPNSGYAIGAVADFNADGKPDVAWRNASTGANAIWLLDGGTLTSTVNLPPINIPQMEMAGPR